MVFGSREMVSGHRSMVLPGSDMPSALGLVVFILVTARVRYLIGLNEVTRWLVNINQSPYR